MAKGFLIASTGSKEDLEKIINKYYYSENYVITEENKVYNTKLNRFLDDVKVVYVRKRWRFEYI